jgi:hypothetical protein
MNKLNEEFVGISVDPSSYARVFDESNRNWERSPEYNLLFLKSQENYMNDLLQARGHVFLNDVYDGLGFKRTSAGQIVGWLANGSGDGHIDFKMQEHQKDTNTPSVHLDFNIDGIIYDKIEG